LGKEEHILYSPEELKARQVSVVRIDRGGEVTLHSPGQLVIYPIINLNSYGKDLKVYLEGLEQVAIDLLHDFGILATRIEGQRGVWVGKDKIASIGVGVRRWVTYHGLAINVNTDLDLFRLIRPCGLDVQMTSISRLEKKKIDITEVKEKFLNHFCRHFQMTDGQNNE
jgi:lipoate-protein ligase B